MKEDNRGIQVIFENTPQQNGGVVLRIDADKNSLIATIAGCNTARHVFDLADVLFVLSKNMKACKYKIFNDSIINKKLEPKNPKFWKQEVDSLKLYNQVLDEYFERVDAAIERKKNQSKK